MNRLSYVVVIGLIGLAACVPAPTASYGATSTVVATEPALASCALTPVIPPTPPAEVPGYTQLDESTGLHVTGTMQVIDVQAYRLGVTGKVDRPLSLTYDDLRCMPKLAEQATLVCPGFFQDEGTWAGVSLKTVLDLAGMQPGATELKLVSADGYATTVAVKNVLAEDNLIAYEWEGNPLPVLHGFPARAVFPALDGNAWVKWLVEIEVK